MGLTEYLAKEREYIPWQSAFRSFSFIDLMLNDNSSLTEFSYLQSYITDLLEPFYLEIGFHPQPDDDHIRKLTRKSLLTWLCKYGYNVGSKITLEDNLFELNLIINLLF